MIGKLLTVAALFIASPAPAQMQQITSTVSAGKLEECIAQAFKPIALPSTVQGDGRRTLYFAQTGPSVTIIDGEQRTLEFKRSLGGYWVRKLERCAAK